MTRGKSRVVAVAVFLVLVSGAFVAYADGAATFNKCKACHGAAGKGNPAMKVQPFDASKPDADLIKVVKEGKGRMPTYGGKLPDAEIAEVVKYIKTLK